MYILGINAYHGGASATLIEDGRLIAAAEEERFTRVKYWAGFPVRAIEYVLAEAGITAYELDHVGISIDPKANLMQKALFTFRNRPTLDFVRDRLSHSLKTNSLKTELANHLKLDGKALKAQFHNVEHHRAHMASAFFVSPYDRAAVLSVDGAGDFVTTMWGTGQGNKLTVQDEILFPHSLGIFYTAVTQWLGFPKYGDEGKTMGLAPYGEPKYMDEMRTLVRIQRDGTFELDLDYFVHHAEGATMTWQDGGPTLGTLFSPKMIELFGQPREPRTEITQQHMDVAASMQAILEEAEFALVRKLQADTQQDTLCMAGGVALNSAFNGKVLPDTAFKDIFVQPSAGDAGTSLGVCYFIYHQILGNPRNFVMTDAYTGPQYDNDAIKAVLERNNLTYTQLDEDALVRRAAEIVAERRHPGLVPGPHGMGPACVGQSQHHRRPAPRRYEGHSQRAHQAPREIPPVRAVGPAGSDRRLLRPDLPGTVHDQGLQRAAGQTGRSARHHACGRHRAFADCRS